MARLFRFPGSFLILAGAASLLAGCAVVPAEAWSFDPTLQHQRPAPDDAQLASLKQRIAQEQARLDAVRAKIAVQPDAGHRLPLYTEEHAVHERMDPLDRELARYAFVR